MSKEVKEIKEEVKTVEKVESNLEKADKEIEKANVSLKKAKKELRNEEKKMLSERNRTTTEYVKESLNLTDKELIVMIRELNQELMERCYKDYIKLLVYLEYELIYDDFYTEEEKEFIVDRVYNEYLDNDDIYVISYELNELVEAAKQEVIDRRKAVDENE